MSKLVAFEALNFMSLGQVRLEFDETGILNLTGYNDSGKSAVTRMIEVLFYDAYRNEQVEFIKDDAEFFGIGAEFDDGVSINKYKYRNGRSVWEMMKGDEVIYTNKLADGVAAMSSVPEPIQRYINVVEDEYTGEKLNIRRNSDRLFLVGMSGGDVYKIINAVLHCDTLAETVKRLNEDRNKIQSELVSKSTTLDTLRTEVTNLQILSDGVVEDLKKQHEKLASLDSQVESIISIGSQYDKISQLEPHQELTLVDTTRFREIQAVLNAKLGVDKTEQELPPELTLVDNSQLLALQEIQRLRQQLDVPIQPEVSPIDLNRISALKEIGTFFNQQWNATNDLNQVDTELEEVKSQLKQLSEQHGFKICQNCGTVAI